MGDKAKIFKLNIPKEKRIICISDIHGHLDLFTRLLKKINFNSNDVLILLGDFYQKGPQGGETLKYIVELSQNNYVYAVRGNHDKVIAKMDDSEKRWIENLPHIIDAGDYVFVHGGISYGKLSEQEAKECMKNDAFMEKELSFDRYIVTGHWPTVNYCHEIPCGNPIIDGEKRIIAVDGGTFKPGGQLNAFFIRNNSFSFDYEDYLPIIKARKNQAQRGGTLNLTWNDRFVELIDKGHEFSTCRHIKTGRTLSIPSADIWSENDGAYCAVNLATDYFLPVEEGDNLSVIRSFENKIFAKKNGVMGWVDIS